MAYVKIEYQNNLLLVKTDVGNFEFFETPANRKTIMIFLRSCKNAETGKPKYSFQNIADAFNYDDRRNVNNYWREFSECDKDFLNFLIRKRKVDLSVVSAVEKEIQKNIMISTTDLYDKIKDQPGMPKLTPVNIRTALGHIPCTVIRKKLLQGWEKGEFHPKEELILEEAMTALQTNDSEAKKTHWLI